MSVSVHTLSFKGPAGITFILLMLASIFYVLAFGSTGWYKNGNVHAGLWATCTSSDPIDAGYFVATQVFITFGLVGLICTLILISIYMCVTPVSKNITLLLLTIVCFVTFGAMLTGIIIFGVEAPSPDWSYAMAIIGSIFTLGAGCASAYQMHQSDVPCVCCRH